MIVHITLKGVRAMLRRGKKVGGVKVRGESQCYSLRAIIENNVLLKNGGITALWSSPAPKDALNRMFSEESQECSGESDIIEEAGRIND